MNINIISFLILKLFILKFSLCKTNSSEDTQKAAKLPPCAACKVLTDSFEKGLDRTSRGKFEGGDTAWEEEKMRSYKKSEIRLVEVQEKLCEEIVRGQVQCHANHEEHEQLIEDWWFKYQSDSPSLYSWLCINQLKVCCLENHYGPKCSPCKGGVENPCSGNGKCKGGGTRKGNGECDCNKGYRGSLCDECALNFFKAYQDDTKVLCDSCNKACDGHCSGPGAKSCTKCKDGWTMETDHGCLDINECLLDENTCKKNQFCINNDGSFNCLLCDKACDGCVGDGPDMCVNCKEGYKLEDGTCADKGNQEREEHMQFARYVTYAGLTVATCIIFQKHIVIAAIFGLFVASYISFSEYYLTHMVDGRPNAPPPIDLSNSEFRRG